MPLAPPHPIRRVPLHLLGQVLSYLETIQSLGSAILTCSSFYAAFQERPDRLISDILSGQIAEETMAYAFALCHASTVDTTDLTRVDDFLTRRFDFSSPNSPRKIRFQPKELSPAVAAALSKTHAVIEYFTRDFVHDTLSYGYDQNLHSPKRSDHACISEIETFRIQRALYRFQLYCTLFFRRRGDLYPDKQRRRHLANVLEWKFFGFFAPWINEQLACIHDYLERVLSRAFDQVAAHDIRWGYESIDWLSVGEKAENKQAYLSNGLHFLFALNHANSYDERVAILKSGGPSLPHTKDMLASHFWHATRNVADDLLAPLGTWQSLDLKCLAHMPGSSDRYMSSSYRAWFEAHRGHFLKYSVYNQSHACLRRCGYVIWDDPVSSASDAVLRDRIDKARRRARVEHQEREEAKVRMKKSWLSRRVMFERGGRGMWKEDDESQVTWVGGASLESSKSCHTDETELTKRSQ